jgi:hypothetical protein
LGAKAMPVIGALLVFACTNYTGQIIQWILAGSEHLHPSTKLITNLKSQSLSWIPLWSFVPFFLSLFCDWNQSHDYL